MRILAPLVLAFGATSCGSYDAIQATSAAEASASDTPEATSLFPGGTATTLPLGNFSASLAVKDIAASKAFYEKLGFTSVGGQQAAGWLVLRSGTTTIGLFQGMFPTNIMTFNPGWDSQAKPVAKFVDVRDIQAKLEAAGIELTTRADPASNGPASITMTDPDGNVILIDQHVARGK
tara:strand:+ start:1312 stop:1842 length:531 start_codon:yes stop_codon:yes gene_type:complete